MANIHHFTVGAIQGIVLHEGQNPMPASRLLELFPDVSESEMNTARAAINHTGDPVSHLNCLYLQVNGTHIVADVGFGEARRPQLGQVVPCLQAAGIQAEDIDIVYLTHFHGDHIIGVTNNDGSPTFPNARYLTSKIEWEQWMEVWAQSEQEAHQQLLDKMQSLEDKFSFVTDGEEIAPGVCSVHLPGHTLGQSGLLVESQGGRLIQLVDVLHQPFQFVHPEWQIIHDTDKLIGAETRRAQLERCASEHLLAMFYHLPFPGLGHVVRFGDAYRWQPLEA